MSAVGPSGRGSWRPPARDLASSCAEWTVPSIDASMRTPVASDKSVLLLSGAVDLNTLPAWADHAKETLPAATHLVVPYVSHSTILKPCPSDIVVQYFQHDGDMASVDTSCLAEMEHPGW